MPGLAEEALLAVRLRKPLYLAGGFGGGAKGVAAAASQCVAVGTVGLLHHKEDEVRDYFASLHEAGSAYRLADTGVTSEEGTPWWWTVRATRPPSCVTYHLPVRVGVADDGALFREGLVLLLRAAGHEVVGAVSNGDDFLALAAREPLDVAVLDIRMPPGEEGGLTTAAALRADHPALPLLVLSHYGEAHYLRKILDVDTRSIGYRIKDEIAGAATLSDTLARLVEGEVVIEPEIAAHLVARPANGGRLDSLGEREREVLGLMAEGRSNASIAAFLHVSTKAVEKHTAGIFAKLNLPTDATGYHRRVLAVLAHLEAAQ